MVSEYTDHNGNLLIMYDSVTIVNMNIYKKELSIADKSKTDTLHQLI